VTDETSAERLTALIRAELANTPIDRWGYFFPCHIAVWRFIEAMRPGVLAPVKASFKAEPEFEGRGAEWFCGVLGSDEAYLNELDAIMYPLVNAIPPEVRERGFLLEKEVPLITPQVVARLASVVLRRTDEAVRSDSLR
jgi:hypothetical protein